MVITPDTSEDPTKLILADGAGKDKGGPPAPVGITLTKDDKEDVFADPAPPPMAHVPLAERRERFRGYIDQLKALREALMGDYNRPVPISGDTAKLLAKAPTAAGPIADGEAPTRWSGSYSGHHQAGTQVVTDQGAWRVFWTRLTQEPMPQVDFTRHRVVAVFLGKRPTAGWSVEILDAAHSPKALVVRYREIPPDPASKPVATPCSPYALLAAPAGNTPVAFKLEK
jgi:hypothetical protein